MASIVNVNRSKKFSWAIYVLAFCVAPYLIRLYLYIIWHSEVPGFFISEMDLFAFCIAVIVHLHSEVHRLNKIPKDLEKSVFQVFLVLYIVLLFVFIYTSLDFEHSINVYRDEYEKALRECKDSVHFETLKQSTEDLKLYLFLTSILFGVLTPIFCYKTLFHEKNLDA